MLAADQIMTVTNEQHTLQRSMQETLFMTDSLRRLRNEAGTVSHGKDGFVAKLSVHHRRSSLLAADAIVTFLHSAYLEREPDPARTLDPYERFEASNAIIDKFAALRAELDEEGFIRAVVVLPDGEEVPLVVEVSRLLYSTQIPVCLWFLARDRSNGLVRSDQLRDRRDEILFIDARKLGHMVDRTRKEFSDADIDKIARAYHAWRGETEAGVYADVPGFCKAASLDDIRKHGHVLTPGRYVGAEAAEEDDEPFADKMARLVADLRAQQGEAARLDTVITANLRELGYGG